MQIDPELLSEKNYTGSRLVEVTDETIIELQKELSSLQVEINPILERLNENYFAPADVLYKEIEKLNEQLKPLKEKLKTLFDENKVDTDFIDAQEQKAQLIKNKLQPLLLDLMKDEVGEFETAKHTVVKDDKIYVEIFDEIEERIKAIRLSKNAK